MNSNVKQVMFVADSIPHFIDAMLEGRLNVREMIGSALIAHWIQSRCSSTDVSLVKTDVVLKVCRVEGTSHGEPFVVTFTIGDMKTLEAELRARCQKAAEREEAEAK